MRPQFDDKDAAIGAARVAAWEQRTGPRVGDFVNMRDSTQRRFTHDWGDCIQTTASGEFAGDASFYFGDGYMNFSGSLDHAIPKTNLHDTGSKKLGRCWFFHHDFPAAHNGVEIETLCRVYEYTA